MQNTLDISALSNEQKNFVTQLVYFLKTQKENPPQSLLEKTGLTTEQAKDLRNRLSTFEIDWNAPGMEEYDKL